MAERNPVLNPELPANASEETRQRTGKYANSLDQTPAKRELAYLRDNAEHFKHQYNILEVKYENSQVFLRRLYELEKEKHYYMCNAVFATFTAAVGTLVMSGTITLWGHIPAASAGLLGGTLLLYSLLLGVCKPLVVEFIWKICSKRVYPFKCPHCHTHLTDRDAEKEEVQA